MKFNRLFAILAVAAMIAAVLCGCSNDGTGDTTAAPSAVTYSVTVVDQNGNAVPNVVVQFTDENGSTDLAVTGANGAASVESEAVMKNAVLGSIPEGYSSTVTEFSFGNEIDLRVTLTAEEATDNSVTYTVTVVDQNNAPVTNVILQFCDEENCKLPMATDENGVVTATYEDSEYHVTLTELPDGYSSEVTEFYFENGTELTIVLTAVEGGE